MAQASERAVKLAKQVLAKCMAYDPHFPNPSQATLMAWAEHISLRNPDPELLLEAVTRFYDSNTDGFKPLPATITTIARDLRRDSSGRETAEQRAVREARIDAKVDGVTQLDSPALGSSAEKITLEEWERRHGVKFPKVVLGLDVPDGPSPLKVRCPWCRQSSGARCIVPGTNQALKNGFHDARHAVVEGRCAPQAGFHVNPHSDYCDLS